MSATPKTTNLHIDPLVAFAKGTYWLFAHVSAGVDLGPLAVELVESVRILRVLAIEGQVYVADPLVDEAIDLFAKGPKK